MPRGMGGGDDRGLVGLGVVKSVRVWLKFGSTRPGKHTKNYGKSPFSMGKSTISMAIFNSKLLVITRG